MQEYSNDLRIKGLRIAFVPTMGFLHAGHRSLMDEGKTRGDNLVVSIFVNPAQFGPSEDLGAYPKDLENDLELMQKKGVDAVFLPEKDQIYPDNFQTYVYLDSLPNHLCGISRPDHFKGVTTIVTKLFNIVKPHIAVFGQKDYQQLAVIRQMVIDLSFDIEIIGADIVREPDGLAMSSRNSNLNSNQRETVRVLYTSLKQAEKLIQNGELDIKKIIQAAREMIISKPETCIDYISICDPHTLEDIEKINGPVLMALAVKVGSTRLIDNMIITP